MYQIQQGQQRAKVGHEGLFMDEFVARLNIEHYRKVLTTETDETKRALIEKLLADEEARLAKQGKKSHSRR